MPDPLFLLAVLCLNVALSEWLVRHTPLRHLGSALLVIVVTAITANTGVIPPYSGDVALYAGVFDFLAPLGIFWLLLQVRLGSLAKLGLPLLILFVVGAAGTVVGVLCGLGLVGGEAFGPQTFALGGMFVGTYVGGSVNFNAVALEYGVQENAALYGGAAVVDSAMTTLWMAINVAVPRFLGGLWRRRGVSSGGLGPAMTGEAEDTETTQPMELALVVALGCLAVWGSRWGAAWLEREQGLEVPSMLVLTVVALVLAQVPAVSRLRGTRVLGMFAVMLFLAVIGALCDLQALREMGSLGTRLSLFVTVTVLVHGLFVYGASLAMKLDAGLASVASQANVGGGTSALALARSLGRGDLVLPAILMGSLGTALGNFLGFAVADWLKP